MCVYLCNYLTRHYTPKIAILTATIMISPFSDKPNLSQFSTGSIQPLVNWGVLSYPHHSGYRIATYYGRNLGILGAGKLG